MIAPEDNLLIDDFEIYNLTEDPNLSANWTIIQNPGSLSLLTDTVDAHGGDQAMRVVTPEYMNPDYTKTKLDLAAPVDIAQYDYLRIWIMRHEDHDFNITIDMLDDQQAVLASSGGVLLSTGSPSNPVGQWSGVYVDLRELTSPSMAASITFDFGASYSAAVGTLDIDDIELINVPGCSAAIVGDLNNDCKIDLIDFCVIASNWLEGTAL